MSVSHLPEHTVSTDAHPVAGVPSSLSSQPDVCASVPWPALNGLLLGWCAWLFAAWAWATWLTYGSLLLWNRIVSLVPAARFVLVSAMVGLMFVWPVVRLSQAPLDVARDRSRGMASPGRAVSPRAVSPGAKLPGAKLLGCWRPLAALGWMLRDWLALNAVLMAVVAAMTVGAGWWPDQVATLGGTMAAWSLLAGVVVMWGATSRRGAVRTLLALAALALLGQQSALPLREVWAVAGPPSAWALHPTGTGQLPLATLWAVAIGAVGLSAAAMGAMALARPSDRS